MVILHENGDRIRSRPLHGVELYNSDSRFITGLQNNRLSAWFVSGLRESKIVFILKKLYRSRARAISWYSEHDFSELDGLIEGYVDNQLLIRITFATQCVIATQQVSEGVLNAFIQTIAATLRNLVVEIGGGRHFLGQ
jgi:hypothetical protein